MSDRDPRSANLALVLFFVDSHAATLICRILHLCDRLRFR